MHQKHPKPKETSDMSPVRPGSAVGQPVDAAGWMRLLRRQQIQKHSVKTRDYTIFSTVMILRQLHSLRKGYNTPFLAPLLIKHS